MLQWAGRVARRGLPLPPRQAIPVAESTYHSDEHLSAWERVKAAFANDWEQTKADFGLSGNRDMDQDADDTLKQMFATDDAFENREQAFRFGHAAWREHGADHPAWSDDLDAKLRAEYPGDYDADRAHIRHAYDYDYRG